MFTSRKIITLAILITLLLQWGVTIILANGPTVDHRFFVELPNGTRRQLEMKGAKIHKSIIMRSSNGDPGNGRVVQDLCRYPDNGGLQRGISGGYHCATGESCFNEDVGAPYLPYNFNSPTKISTLADASYMNYYNETFTTMLSREAPYLVPLYDPTSIRGFAGARWQGNVDWAIGSGGFQIINSGGDPHASEPIIGGAASWGTVTGYSGQQSWGPGEMYRNPQGGNILQGKVSWTLITPDQVPPRTPTAGFAGACRQLSCPAENSYYFKVINIEPTDITSAHTKANFMLTFYGGPWSAAQKNAVKTLLGEPTFSGGPNDFAYTIGQSNDVKSENGKPMLDLQWTGDNQIGAGGRTLNDLINWTEQQKAEGIPVPNYTVAANLTIDGGQTQNDYVGGVGLSLLRNECDTCGSTEEKPTGTMSGSIIACTATAPQTQTYTVNNIDLKGNQFESINFFLQFQYNANTARLIGVGGQPGFLGNPQFSQWVTEGRAVPRNGDWFLYTLRSINQYSGEGSVSFTWNDSVTFGNGKTLSQLITFVQSNGLSNYAIVSANIQVRRAGVLMQNDSVGSVLTEFKPACPEDLCPPAEQGTPNAPVIITPSNLETSIPVNALNQFTLSWKQLNALNGRGNVVDEYEVLIYKSDAYASPDAALAALNNVDYLNGELPPTDIIRIWQNANTSNYDTTYSKLITVPPAMGYNISISIRSINNRPIECATPGDASTISNWTTIPDIELEAEFGGNFYISASCNLATAEPLSLTNASFVSVIKDSNGQEYTTPANGNSYTVAIPPGTADYFPKLKLDQAGLPEALVCSSCNPDLGDGFCHRGRTQGPTATAHFFLESYNLNFESWWQTRSGLVYGHSGVRSTLPLESGSKNPDCVAAGDYCEPFIVRKTIVGGDWSAGVPMTFGSFTGVNGWWSDRLGGAHADSGSDNKTRVTKENYGYFVSKIEMPAQDITDGSIDTLSEIPPGTIQRGARVSYRNGDLTLRPDGTWIIPSGEKRVIFVNGNLTISQPTDQPVMLVDEGGFLAFIVKGNITIDSTVGHENPDEITPNISLEPSISGIFIADNRLIILSRGSDDKKFVGAGSFIGWSGVELHRTFDNGGLGKFRNTTTPTETFTFRPDLVSNTPDLLKFTDLVWQEVN